MDIFSSPSGRLLALKIMRYVASVSLLFQILSATKNKYYAVSYIFILLILNFNFYLRAKLLKQNKSFILINHASFLLSVIIVAFFNYKYDSFGSEAYNVMLIIEIVANNRKIDISQLITSLLGYLIANMNYININKLYTLENFAIKYGLSLYVAFIVRTLIIEKEKIVKLNDELQEANAKLKEYSDQIEILAVTKERTRIAQELHDSIGHSLVALKMNLEYAENVLDLKPEKAKEVIQKAENILVDSIGNLRRVVSLLKEESKVENLREAINKLFDNFIYTNTIKLNLELDDIIETVNPDIKNCIYKTVRESVTNGIKHGSAHIFQIEILKGINVIKLSLKNDGKTCSTIVKSNGLSGIEARIKALGGNVQFTNEEKWGFVINATIPMLEDN